MLTRLPAGRGRRHLMCPIQPIRLTLSRSHAAGEADARHRPRSKGMQRLTLGNRRQPCRRTTAAERLSTADTATAHRPEARGPDQGLHGCELLRAGEVFRLTDHQENTAGPRSQLAAGHPSISCL